MGSLQKFAKEMMTERRLELSIIGSKKGDVPDRKGLLTLMREHLLIKFH